MSDEKSAKIVQFKGSSSAVAENKTTSKNAAHANLKEFVSYSFLEDRYGPRAAYSILLAMERIAQIEEDVECDPEERFENIPEALYGKPPRTIH